MNAFQKTIFFICVSLLLASCNSAIEQALIGYSKTGLKDACGKEDLACIAAVDSQFDACHTQYENEWSAFQKASNSEADKLMDAYGAKLAACIVDENGESYFSFGDPSS